MNTRRNFIKQTLAGSAVISLSGAVPHLLLSATRPPMRPTGRPTGHPSENVLVVIQLTGGNDGLNTVVPFSDDEYLKNRFTLAIGKSNVLKINDRIGFHPSLRGFEKMLQDGQLSVIQGVGYPQPNRSHFESMDLWHTAHQAEQRDRLGWLGNTIDRYLGDSDLPAVHFGSELQPLALKTQRQPVPSIRSLDDFTLKVFQNAQTKKMLQPLITAPPKPGNALLSYLHESADVALATSHQLAGIQGKSRKEYDYPGSNFGRNLGVIAQLIGSGLKTQIYYTTLDGFDTHSNQAAAHQGLMSELSASTSAFMKELSDQGNSGRVSTLVFSEFGRRVRENASGGTDHGTAAPVFVLGSAVKQPVIGKHPSLKDLDQGDLKYAIDYRRVYADLLENWLNVDSKAILGGRFEPAGLFAS